MKSKKDRTVVGKPVVDVSTTSDATATAELAPAETTAVVAEQAASPAAAPASEQTKIFLDLAALTSAGKAKRYPNGNVRYGNERIHVSSYVKAAAARVKAGEIASTMTRFRGKDVLNVSVDEALMDQLLPEAKAIQLAYDEQRKAELAARPNKDAGQNGKANQPSREMTPVEEAERALKNALDNAKYLLDTKGEQYDLEEAFSEFDEVMVEYIILADKATVETLQPLLERAQVLPGKIHLAILKGMSAQIDKAVNEQGVSETLAKALQNKAARIIKEAEANPAKVYDLKGAMFEIFGQIKIAAQHKPRTPRGMTIREATEVNGKRRGHGQRVDRRGEGAITPSYFQK